jgi:hypothetical protein
VRNEVISLLLGAGIFYNIPALISQRLVGGGGDYPTIGVNSGHRFSTEFSQLIGLRLYQPGPKLHETGVQMTKQNTGLKFAKYIFYEPILLEL